MIATQPVSVPPDSAIQSRSRGFFLRANSINGAAT